MIFMTLILIMYSMFKAQLRNAHRLKYHLKKWYEKLMKYIVP